MKNAGVTRVFGQTLETLENQLFGWWILIADAIGLIAYGLYLMSAARYLRLNAAR